MNLLSKFKNKKEIVDIAVSKDNYYSQYIRKITPALIEEYEDHIIIDKSLFVTCVIVGVPWKHHNGFPRNLSPNFTSQFMAIEQTDEFLIDISFKCSPIAPDESMALLDNSMYINQISMSQIDKDVKKESDISIHSMRYDLRHQDFSYMFTELYKNNQKLFDTQYIIVIKSKSRDGLKRGISSVFGVLKSNIVNKEIPYHQILNTYLAALPLPISIEFAEMQQLSNSCGALLPLVDPLVPLAETGMIYGLRKADDSPFIIDWNSLAAGHHMVIGGSGSGKTVELMKLMMTGHDMLGHRYIYITPKPDNRTNYLNVANYYGDNAETILIGSGKDGNEYRNINPLQVMIDKNQTMLDESDYIQLFNNHLELLTAFFSVMDTSVNMDDYLIQSVIEIYRRFGIDRKHIDTWKNRKGDEWPVLLDLREIWKEDNEKKNPSALAMLNRTSRLETSWEYINRPTDVSMSKDIIIIDISKVPASLQDAMNVFVTGLAGMRFNTDLTKKSCVIIDEGRVFLQNKNLTEFILRMYTQGRSFDLSAIFTTQQVSDIKDDDMKELFKTNSFVNVIMGNVQPNSYKGLESFFNLTETDMNQLKTCGVGEGLIQVRGKSTAVKFKLTDLEKQVILDAKKPGEKAVVDGGFRLIDNRLIPLIDQENSILSFWVDGDPKVLGRNREAINIQRTFGRGMTQIWIPFGKVENRKIMNQSIDHYGTVLQIAAELIMKGFDSVEINHYDDADIVAELNGHTLAIEYELPGSHTQKELIEKNQRLKTKYERVVFVVPGVYYSSVAYEKCIGPENTVSRGAQLDEYITNLVYEFKR